MARVAQPRALRLAADLARTLDALLIEEVEPSRLARSRRRMRASWRAHWEKSLEKLQLIYEHWPPVLAEQGAIDLAERRNRLLQRLAERWKNEPPAGFTVAAGITTAAPAVAALLARVARMPEGMVVLPGLWLVERHARRGMGRARAGREWTGRGDAIRNSI